MKNSKDRVTSFGLMGPHMKATLLKIILKDLAPIYGLIRELSLANGQIIKCMEKVYLNG